MKCSFTPVCFDQKNIALLVNSEPLSQTIASASGRLSRSNSRATRAPVSKKSTIWATLSRQLLTPLRAHLKAFLSIDPVGALGVDDMPLCFQHVVQSRIAIAWVLLGKRLQPGSEFVIVPVFQLPPHGRTTKSHKPASAALTELTTFQVIDRSSPLPGRHHFPSTNSLRAALSSSASANNFFSFAFSASSCRSFLASETSIPLYFDFQR